MKIVGHIKHYAIISSVQIIPFKGHSDVNQFFLEVIGHSVWTFEMADQSLCESFIRTSWVSAFIVFFYGKKNYHFLLWTRLPSVELRGTCLP